MNTEADTPFLIFFFLLLREAERIKHALFILSKIKGTHYNYF